MFGAFKRPKSDSALWCMEKGCDYTANSQLEQDFSFTIRILISDFILVSLASSVILHVHIVWCTTCRLDVASSKPNAIAIALRSFSTGVTKERNTKSLVKFYTRRKRARSLSHQENRVLAALTMARGKFNKRAGGPRLDAVNAEEIAIRNARMEELEEQRTNRRAEEDEDEGGEEGGDDKEKKEEEAPMQAERKKKDAAPAGGPVVPVTTEADHKRNLAKLAEVRRRREEAETKRKQEEQLEKELDEETKKLAELVTKGGDDEDGGKKSKSTKNTIPKLDKITIKKMKPAQMKEAMKERGLDIQGNAKELLQRLLDYEANR